MITSNCYKISKNKGEISSSIFKLIYMNGGISLLNNEFIRMNRLIETNTQINVSNAYTLKNQTERDEMLWIIS